MKLQSTLSILVGVIMIVGFLAQMWDLFDKFLGQSKTVAVSFEERGALEFPSFAFCDSRAFRNNTLVEQLGNEVFFNATTFDLVKDVEVGGLVLGQDDTEKVIVLNIMLQSKLF